MKNTISNQISFSEAKACQVKTASDESVGNIKDCVLNTQTREVEYVVLKVNEGFLNLGSKLLALPLESFEFQTEQEDVIVVKESIETLENAPGFYEGEWPDGPQSEFMHSMRTYYSEEPRSLYGRYDSRNRAFFDVEDQYDNGSDRIRHSKYGDGFLETDQRENRESDIRRGGDPIL